MDVRNCTRCGRIYNYDHYKICLSCRKNDEVDFQKVKEFLGENPGANISDVVDSTKVDTKKVIEFLKEGRLEIQGGGSILLECEKCGVGINTGRFCSKCTGGLQRELGQVMNSTKSREDAKEKSEEKFRLIDRYGKRR